MGTFYPTYTDQEGEIRVLNRTVPHVDWSGTEALLDLLQEKFGQALLAVGLRGSVVAGSWVEGVSDVDAFALVEGGEWTRWANEKVDGWPGVDLGWATWTADFAERNARVAAMLATQGRTIWGKKLVETLPSPRLRDLVRHRSWAADDVAHFCALNPGADHPETVRRSGQTMIKTLLRSAFEMVMLREGKYATDFHPCVSTFLRHFPSWEPQLYKLVEAYPHPAKYAVEIKSIARDLVTFFEENEALE